MTPPAWRGWLAVLAGSAAAIVTASWLAPRWPWPPSSGAAFALLAYVSGFAAVSAMALASAARLPAPGRIAWAAVPIGAALFAIGWSGIPSSAWLAAAIAMLLLAGGGLVGALVGSRVEHVGHLLVVALASSIADAWSVFAPAGPTAAIATDATLLSVLALPFPMLGTTAIEPILGLGDVVFVALYVASARKFELGIRRTLIAFAFALAATCAAVVLAERALPALPFLGAAMLLAHPAARVPPAHERRTVALLLALLVGAGLVLLLAR